MKLNQAAITLLGTYSFMLSNTDAAETVKSGLIHKFSSVLSIKDDCEENPGTASTDSPDSPAEVHVHDRSANCPVFKDNPTDNIELSNRMIEAAKPCGYYEEQGCTDEVIPASIDFPGEGVGDLETKPYIVQFDIGVHPNIKKTVLDTHNGYNGDDKRDCIGCDKAGETCLELIVMGDSQATGTGCAGKCGSGCVVGGGWAKDCMKHDVCTTYKALVQRKDSGIDVMAGDGFCYDPDCGDEAAQTVFNCYIDEWWPRPDSPMTCEKDNFGSQDAYGAWSYTTGLPGFGEGPCHQFTYWNNGQGLPDKNRISNPYAFLDHLASKGVDVSAGYKAVAPDYADISRVE